MEPPTDEAPCASCYNLKRGHLVINKESLDKGVEGGCEGCRLLKKAISHFLSYDSVRQVDLLIDCALYLTIHEHESKKTHHIELYTEEGNPAIWNIGPGRTLNSESSLKESCELIQRWLRDCRKRHSSCKVKLEAPLPTRVIDVGTADDGVRLYVTEREPASYVALSHCWGRGTPVKTTKDTLSTHQGSLNLPPECQTFIDAVEVTRALGIQYLWIDSLCIVQDDEEDWATEAAGMTSVYHNATLTLSADGADDASGGLFGSAPSRKAAHQTFTILTVNSEGDEAAVCARKRFQLPSGPRSAPHSSVEAQPSKLSTRGWVLQEKLLSTRIVHFYREELVWSCYAQERCECRLLPSTSTSSQFRRLLSTERPGIHLVAEWPKLVQEFTARDLTYSKDRLAAISGLAGLVQQHVPFKYLSGLWGVDLEYSLLWISDHERARSPIRRVLDTPYASSWSWATIDGPVRYYHRFLDQFKHRRSGEDEIQIKMRVVKAMTRPCTSNPFGPVNMGFVTLRGQLLPIKYIPEQRVWRPCLAPQQPASGGSAFQDNGATDQFLAPRIEPTFIYDVLDESPEREGGDATKVSFALLRVATRIWGGKWTTESTEVVAMLLCLGFIKDGVDVYLRRGMVLNAFNRETVWEGMPVRDAIIC